MESRVNQSPGWHCISRNLPSRPPHRKRSERRQYGDGRRGERGSVRIARRGRRSRSAPQMRSTPRRRAIVRMKIPHDPSANAASRGCTRIPRHCSPCAGAARRIFRAKTSRRAMNSLEMQRSITRHRFAHQAASGARIFTTENGGHEKQGIQSAAGICFRARRIMDRRRQCGSARISSSLCSQLSVTLFSTSARDGRHGLRSRREGRRHEPRIHGGIPRRAHHRDSHARTHRKSRCGPRAAVRTRARATFSRKKSSLPRREAGQA